MLKIILSALSLVILANCENGGRSENQEPSPTTTIPSVTTTLPPVVVEPGQQPVRITEIGLKVGQCKQASADLKWMDIGPWGGNNPCEPGSVPGQACAEEHTQCRMGGSVYLCHNYAPKTCYGWVYEKDVVSGANKPLANVNVDLFNFALCLSGICNPLLGPVKTNEFGYFEMVGKGIPESTSVRAWTDGYYGVCGQDNKPTCINGRCSTGDTLLDSRKWEIRPIQLMKITPTSCN
jgi:hypothetical protein